MRSYLKNLRRSRCVAADLRSAPVINWDQYSIGIVMSSDVFSNTYIRLGQYIHLWRVS